MKTLFVIRHAKSSWDHPELSDFERPLNNRGEKAAPRIGKEMSARGYFPELVISSSALRAKMTTELVVNAAGTDCEIVFDRRIYGAGANTLIHIVSEAGDSLDSLMIVGHNPGFEHLVSVLTGESPTMPTAALAVIQFDFADWQEIEAGKGKLIDHLIPKELK